MKKNSFKFCHHLLTSFFFSFIALAALTAFTACTNDTDENDDDSSSSSSSSTSDVLFIQILAGDNSLNDSCYADMVSVQNGLALCLDSNKKWTDLSVRVIAFWDGLNNSTGSESDKSNKYYIEKSRVLELKANSTLLADRNVIKNNVYSSEEADFFSTTDGFTDLSSTASFLSSTSGSQEVDMTQSSTILSFLSWVNTHYKGTKRTILSFSGQGIGPRGMLSDSSNPNQYLSTRSLGKLLKQSGFAKNKFFMIIENASTTATIENAYELRNYADYLMLSPGLGSSSGYDYKNIIPALAASDSSSIPDNLIKIFQQSYSSVSSLGVSNWASLLTSTKTKMEALSDKGIEYYSCDWTTNPSSGDYSGTSKVITESNFDRYLGGNSSYISNPMPSLTIVASSKLDALYEKWNLLSNLLNTAISDSTVKTNLNSKLTALPFQLYYQSSYEKLFDAASLLNQLSDLITDGTLSDSISCNSTTYSLSSTITEVKAALVDAITCAYRMGQTEMDEVSGLYSRASSSNLTDILYYSTSSSSCAYGLSIVSSSYSDTYKNNLEFANSNAWASFLQSMYSSN